MNWRAAPRRAFPYLLTAAGGFLLAYLLIFFFAFPAEVIPDDADVPNVVGLMYSDGAQRIEKAGFHAVQGESRFHPRAPEGTVLQQDPPAESSQKRGIDVRLAVSAGQRSAPVPQITGLSEQQARVSIANAGFELGTVRREASDQPRGSIIASTPPSGEVLQLPAKVNIVVSDGPAIVVAPDLVGRTLPDARSLLEQIGLRIGGVGRDTSSFQPENTIISQSPPAGQAVSAGGRINVVVSRFPPASSLAVPSRPDTLPQ
ncbi:MAG TPA: PASTA domain-containing protein [Gemmatimonadaceae bacterium]|nr:PASTA domain-containing protein [Gemmatimonadaceae bacterium]